MTWAAFLEALYEFIVSTVLPFLGCQRREPPDETVELRRNPSFFWVAVKHDIESQNKAGERVSAIPLVIPSQSR